MSELLISTTILISLIKCTELLARMCTRSSNQDSLANISKSINSNARYIQSNIKSFSVLCFVFNVFNAFVLLFIVKSLFNKFESTSLSVNFFLAIAALITTITLFTYLVGHFKNKLNNYSVMHMQGNLSWTL